MQANAYVTPPQNRGFDAHYDVHDVFVLQIAGTKRWIVHEPVHPDPLRDRPWTDHRTAVAEAARGEAHLDTVLEPGDVLYLPRGWLHAAEAQGAVSIHLTLGVHTWTRHALAEQLTRAALALLRDDPEMRGSLPLGAEGPEDELALVRRRLVDALAEADPEPLFHRARRAQARPGPLGPLAQLAAVDGLSAGTPVRLRGALEARLDGGRLSTRVGWLDLPEADLPRCAGSSTGRPVTPATSASPSSSDSCARASSCPPGREAAGMTAPARFFCAEAARSRGDALAGTAPYGSVWILVEHRAGWPVNGFDGLDLEPEVKARVYTAAQALRARILLIRRHGRRSPDDPPRWAVLRYDGDGAHRQKWGVWRNDRDLAEIVDALDSPGERDHPPVVLVCAHGTHDACCAVRGRPVGRALSDRWPELVWECTHVGATGSPPTSSSRPTASTTVTSTPPRR